MVVGYINQNAQIFCADCWPSQVEAGSRPGQVLDSEEADAPGANFWVVDACAGWGCEIKYQAATTLN